MKFFYALSIVGLAAAVPIVDVNGASAKDMVSKRQGKSQQHVVLLHFL
jgi:hypothetical protein